MFKMKFKIKNEYYFLINLLQVANVVKRLNFSFNFPDKHFYSSLQFSSIGGATLHCSRLGLLNA